MKIAEWIKENQNKHFCKCGCGQDLFKQNLKKITFRKWHGLSCGIPEFIHGHARQGQRKYIVCKICGKEVYQQYPFHGYCYEHLCQYRNKISKEYWHKNLLKMRKRHREYDKKYRQSKKYREKKSKFRKLFYKKNRDTELGKSWLRNHCGLVSKQIPSWLLTGVITNHKTKEVANAFQEK